MKYGQLEVYKFKYFGEITARVHLPGRILVRVLYNI